MTYGQLLNSVSVKKTVLKYLQIKVFSYFHFLTVNMYGSNFNVLV